MSRRNVSAVCCRWTTPSSIVQVPVRSASNAGWPLIAGTWTIARNTLIRAGNSDFNWQFGVGAIWFNGLNEPIRGAAITVSDSGPRGVGKAVGRCSTTPSSGAGACSIVDTVEG